ncbi:uncharacterized protein YdeI (BOF family) [Paraburkholderia sp. GAS42]|jgi:hypothetical protein
MLFVRYRGSAQAMPDLETIMKRIAMAMCAFTLLASAGAFAQTNSGKPQPADQQAGQGMQPGKEGQSMSRAAEAGSTHPASGTLMQQRENVMSRQGASGDDATGKMKQ